ncbi:YqaA family protein [Novispirillum sp. DQ9]|uniref:YqaA family protein n=1 Tax=Novispirillum sp. DQ9 TaxID=3398612 RepID=UPI003C7C5C8F
MPDGAAKSDEGGDGGGRVGRWTERLKSARHKDAMLFGASFLETLVLPIPIELVLVPYMLSRRDRIWWIATVALAGCLLAALAGYAFGWLFMRGLGGPLLESMGWTEVWNGFQGTFDRQGFWAVIAVGVTPVPFQVAILTAGAAHYPVPLFLAAAAVARGLRYYGLALLVAWIGPGTLRLWHRHKITASVLAATLVALAWGGTALLGSGG